MKILINQINKKTIIKMIIYMTSNNNKIKSNLNNRPIKIKE